MKKFLVAFVLLFVSLGVNAEVIQFEELPNMHNYWQNNGKDQEKILDVGNRIINTNRLNKRIVLNLVNNTKVVNAYASFTQKSVNIYTGILPYCDNDDELAAIIAHEIAHCLDYYDGGFTRWLLAMRFNSKEYEYKADLVGIDLMAKAGYNPVAMITMGNKVLDESYWDNFLFWSHPKGSKRTLAEYKYIYKKYPWAINSDMVKNVNYQNFVNYSQKDINNFVQREKLKSIRRGDDL